MIGNMIEITESPDTRQRREFVLNLTHGKIFKMPEMADFYRRTKNYEPVTLAVVDTKPFFKKEIFTKEILYFIVTVQQFKIGRKRKTNNALNQKRRGNLV